LDVPSDPVIRVHDLSYSYPDGPEALQEISFEIQAGESVGVVGPNGAGKTTLFLCLMGVVAPKTNAVWVAGLDPANPSERRALPANAGIVFQNSDDQIFNASVMDDVAFGPLNLGLPPDEVRQRVATALERVGLKGFEHRVPFHLSGGEKRRVALAGVLAMQPQVLLLDEPSSHLDPRGRRELIGLINGLEVTKLIAAHDLELIRETCSRILLVDRGRLIADGPLRAVLTDSSLMEAHGLEVPHSLSHHAKWQQHHPE
jgi:cobalt/nickel transport system ATP-binding protein